MPMQLLIVALVIAVVYVAACKLLGFNPGPRGDMLVWFVVGVLVFVWFLCFLGIWCPPHKL